ncbi:NAD(P)-dependent oxidoreductase [Acidisoma sp.]|uniref:NAD(P)-dependent oxidoreductase n=1 Tax=Acidisoma sp. TaxID=1872115 RepID=UPI003B007A97
MTLETSLVWIGLGKLGLPMAARIANAGHDIVGHDLDPDRIDVARARQVAIAENPVQAVHDATAVLTSLPDDRSFEAALCGEGGLIAGMESGAILVDTSTVSPEASARVAIAAEARGIAYLRAPVSGNPVLAERGELTVLASGPRDAFERLRPALLAISKAQHYLGEAEQARYAKLSINLMIAVSAGMMAEAMALARRGGVDAGQMLDLLADSAVGSPMVKYKTPPLKAGDYTSTFSCRQMAKDLDLILDAARATDVPAPLAAQQREAYSALIASGDGEADFIATVRHAARLAGFRDADSPTGDGA